MPEKTMLSYAVVIPARFASSRFLGKPLVDILGKPMIQHVWERCCQAVECDRVFVATDDLRIRQACESFSANVMMTSSDCKTGTDRLAEVNESLDCDFLINVQGDEPLVEPRDIRTVINSYLKGEQSVINAMCQITSESEFRSLTVPKVVTSVDKSLLYMSRAPIPLTKDGGYVNAYKQVCIYAFGRQHLKFFASCHNKSPMEEVEDIEILRFLEHKYPVRMVEVPSGSIAVDVPQDLEKVLRILADSH